MRKHLFILFLFCSVFSFAQVEVQNNAASEEEIELEEAPLADTVAVEPSYYKSIEKAKDRDAGNRLKKAKAPIKEDFDKLEERSAAEQSATRTETLKSSFSYSKNQSAHQRTQRTPSASQQKQMDEAVAYFELYAPNTFEHHYFKYVAGNYNTELISHLLKAEKLRPNNSDVHRELAAYYIITGELSKAETYLRKLQVNKRLTQPVISYGKDILKSVPDSGVLITHGFDDTYAVWYDQQVNGIRKDVELVSLDFLQSEAYRSNLKKKGLKIPNREKVDVYFLKQFCSLNKQVNLAISLTTPKEYFVPIQDKLYVTGLVFEYHESAFSNFSRNENLWNSLLDKTIVNAAYDSKSKQLSANYLPMLFQLRSVYFELGDKERLKIIDESIDKIGVQSNKYNQVQKIKNAY